MTTNNEIDAWEFALDTSLKMIVNENARISKIRLSNTFKSVFWGWIFLLMALCSAAAVPFHKPAGNNQIGVASIVSLLIAAAFPLLSRRSLRVSEVSSVGSSTSEREARKSPDLWLKKLREEVPQLERVSGDLERIRVQLEINETKHQTFGFSRTFAGLLCLSAVAVCQLYLMLADSHDFTFLASFLGSSCIGASYGLLGRRPSEMEQLLVDATFVAEYVAPLRYSYNPREVEQ